MNLFKLQPFYANMGHALMFKFEEIGQNGKTIDNVHTLKFFLELQLFFICSLEIEGWYSRIEWRVKKPGLARKKTYILCKTYLSHICDQILFERTKQFVIDMLLKLWLAKTYLSSEYWTCACLSQTQSRETKVNWSCRDYNFKVLWS